MRLALLFVCGSPARAPPSVFRSIRDDIMEIEPWLYPLMRVFRTRLLDDDDGRSRYRVSRDAPCICLDSSRAWARAAAYL